MTAPHIRLVDSIKGAAAHGHSFYVYTLADTGGVFYVGKGKGRRIFAHGKPDAQDTNYTKQLRIQEAERVERAVVAFFREEWAAYAFERELIAQHGPGLTNIASGCTASAEASRARLLLLKSKLAPLEVWRTTASAWQRDMAIELHGSVEAFYSAFTTELDRLLTYGSPTTLFVPFAGTGSGFSNAVKE